MLHHNKECVQMFDISFYKTDLFYLAVYVRLFRMNVLVGHKQIITFGLVVGYLI